MAEEKVTFGPLLNTSVLPTPVFAVACTCVVASDVVSFPMFFWCIIVPNDPPGHKLSSEVISLAQLLEFVGCGRLEYLIFSRVTLCATSYQTRNHGLVCHSWCRERTEKLSLHVQNGIPQFLL